VSLGELRDHNYEEWHTHRWSSC